MPYSSGGRPTTALSAMFGICSPVEVPDVAAVLLAHHARRLRLVLRRQVLLEHARRLDDVVVDAHEDQIIGVAWLFVSIRPRAVLAVARRATAPLLRWTSASG